MTKRIHIDQIWEYVEQGKTNNVCLRTAVKDAKAGSGTYWQNKLLSMYLNRSQVAMCNCCDFQIVTDGSVHSTQDLLISVAYVHESNVAVNLPGQCLWPAKICTPGDFQDADEELQRTLARREQQRLSSFKFLQAISHQLEVVTSKRVTLETFKCHSDLAPIMQPLTPSHGRPEVLNEQIYLDGLYYNVIEWSNCQGCLILTMDQSPSDMAAAAFLLEGVPGGFFVHCDWDWYHRLSNDCKHAEGQLQFSKIKLATQYLSCHIIYYLLLFNHK